VEDRLRAAWEGVKSQGQKTLSLDPQEQSLAEIGGEFAAGLLPGVGQAMSARDFERSRRDDDKLGMALAAVGMLPFGRVIKGGKDAVSRVMTEAKFPRDKEAIGKADEIYRAAGSNLSPEVNAKVRDEILKETGLIRTPIAGHTDRYMRDVYLGEPKKVTIARSKGFNDVFPKADLSSLPALERERLQRMIIQADRLPKKTSEHVLSEGAYNPNTNTATAFYRPETFDYGAYTNTLGHETNHAPQIVQPWSATGSSPARENLSQILIGGTLENMPPLTLKQLDSLDDVARQFNFENGDDLMHALEANKVGLATPDKVTRLKAFKAYNQNIGEVNSSMSGDIAEKTVKGVQAEPFMRELTDKKIIVQPGAKIDRLTSTNLPRLDSDLPMLYEALKAIKAIK
jgi:hypothetical protein